MLVGQVVKPKLAGNKLIDVATYRILRGRDYGKAVLGARIEVLWPEEDHFFAGEINEYDEATGEHLLRCVGAKLSRQ